MSVWTEIDRLKAEHDAMMKRTADALEGLSAIKGSLRFDEYGFFYCRYVPRGERKQETLKARSGGGARRAARRHPQSGNREEVRLS